MPTHDRPPRVVLVTGASSGIGEAVAHRVARRGDHVVLLARGREALERVARDCDRLGAASTMVEPADISVDAHVEAAVGTVMARHGWIDTVVGSAGVVAYGRVDEVPQDVFDQVVATNLLGSVNLARHVVPVLRTQGSGSLVHVGSVIGHIAVPEMGAYVLSKWGVRALVRQLQVDNRDRPHVRIEYVAPGGVDTPIYRQAATYGEAVGRPPFPVTTPERIADRVLDVADGRRRGGQVGLANEVIRFGFTALPWAYDRLVGPLFSLAAQDLTAPRRTGPGNVLESQQDGNALRGGHGNALVAIGANVVEVLRERMQRPAPGDRAPAPHHSRS
ncbi:NAD(P)-dependent dehydrogenase (short-subunit alcohol dehydrogenase family) [Nocardioides cavernae]|uniref:NAD(P)-dependent dehydrogenase (Short-subunit alcohol dehydrogenase family) n=1 Tax=Nocardioides cavernae TaxID=1921566 RepID=A0A7Y9H6Y5_9ACTN|nr:SDR family oxidoreductase [Nocardioides cavernae]NYE38424.1 NAD(P)-dependent dehydrogenase (short-subunit alcohol dehydrogenase family) [Nocardioides cavernae]